MGSAIAYEGLQQAVTCARSTARHLHTQISLRLMTAVEVFVIQGVGWSGICAHARPMNIRNADPWVICSTNAVEGCRAQVS